MIDQNNSIRYNLFHHRGALVMSEYQYYEFQAIDRHLTDKEMSELRSFSTRAESAG
jgi:hypothetical protein